MATLAPFCTFDAAGYCERHRRVHTESEMPWCTDDSPMGDAMRLEWDRLVGLADRPPAGTPVKAAEPENRGPCRHFTDYPLSRDGCGSCVRRWIYPCEVYGHCTPAGHHPLVKRCDDCPHHQAEADEAPDFKPRRVVLENKLCPGDVVVMGAAIDSLHKAHPGAFLTAVTGTSCELFHHHPDVIAAGPGHWETIKMEYPLVNQCNVRPVHFMQGYCDHLAEQLGVPIPLLVNRPRLYLSPEERSWLSQVQEITGKPTRYWIVNAGHKEDYTAKWWGSSNYQEVVDHLRGRVVFVQVGELNHFHPPLAGVIDLRGKTSTRQLMRLVWHSCGGLGPSTYLQHLCAAFDRPYVCIAGGREPVAWQHYPRQATFSNIGAVECEPSRRGESCWRDHTILKEGRFGSTCELPVLTAADEWVPKCLALLSPAVVAREIELRYTAWPLPQIS